MSQGKTQAEAARIVGVDRSTINRWLGDADFQDLLAEADSQDSQNLAHLIPQAYSLLERALAGEQVTVGRARIALDILKTASAVEKAQSGESSFEKRLADLDATGQYG